MEAERKRRHDIAIEGSEPGYMDPETGLFVLTAHFLAARGRCCGSGCRHCPYPEVEQSRAGRPKRKR
ncbi:MAG: DUF5522 domain-containing protein [Myxococcota bacterium]